MRDNTIKGIPMMDLSDLRNCPDHLHIRTYLYLLNTAPEVLEREVRGWKIPRSEARHGARLPGFEARFAGTCARCRAEVRRGDRVVYGEGGLLAHLPCHLAVLARDRKAAEARRLRDAEHARRRRERTAVIR